MAAPAIELEPIRDLLFTAVVTVASRVLLFRDRLLNVVGKLRRPGASERLELVSGNRKLDAVSAPGTVPQPVVVVCHGIGETVDHWSAVQAYLQDQGIGSFVFDYSGYGNSSGRIRIRSCEEDLASAYAEATRRAGPQFSVFVLGFSLGSGIAAHGAGTLVPRPAGLILCEAFTSFREAAFAAHLPRCMSALVPNVWNSAESVRTNVLPTLVVHSDADALFSIEMAYALAAPEHTELMVISGYRHNELYLRAEAAYWSGIVTWINRIAAHERTISVRD